MDWPTVTSQDVEDRWRPLSDEEKSVASVRIGDAEAELRTALRLRGVLLPPLFDTSAENADWQRRFVMTVAEAVARFLKNPEGWAEEREQLDDWSETRRRSRDAGEGRLFISDAEADDLVPRQKPRRGAFTVRLGQS